MKLAELEERKVAFKHFEANVFDIMSQGLITPEVKFGDYIRDTWPIVEPAREYLHNWHIDCIAEHLQAVELGQITRLNINIPPRNMKSTLCSVQFPTWYWSLKPWAWFLFISYSGNLASFHSKKRRDVIMSSWYQNRWGSTVNFSKDQNQKAEFQNTASGGMIASSPEGTVTGKGADIIVVDDGMNPKDAESKAEREKAAEFVRSTIKTRLNDKKRGVIINVAQRLHREDVTSALIESGNWVNLVLPAECEKKTIITFPISQRVIERQVGEVLWEEREPKDVLIQQKKDMRPRAYNAQYQQNPSSTELEFFKRDKWKFYPLPPHEMIKQMAMVIMSWDMSFKKTEDGSYVAGLLLGYKAPDWYILDEVHRRMDFASTKAAVKTFVGKWPVASAKLIEDKANGPAIISELRTVIAGLLEEPVEGGGKEARASSVTPYQESGNILLPEPNHAPWVHEYIEECANFPGEPNDRVDALSQGVNWFLKRQRNQPKVTVIDYEEE